MAALRLGPTTIIPTGIMLTLVTPRTVGKCLWVAAIQLFKSGMTDLAPHRHLLFSVRFPIQKGKMAGVCHQWERGGEEMGVRDVGLGVRSQNLSFQVPRLLSWLLLLSLPSPSLFLGKFVHAFFFFWRRNLKGFTGITMSDNNNHYHHHLRAVFKWLSKNQNREKSRVYVHGAIGFSIGWKTGASLVSQSLSVAIAIA